METGGHGICLSQGIRQQMPKPRDRAASAETQASRTRDNVGRSLRCGSGVSAAVASVPGVHEPAVGDSAVPMQGSCARWCSCHSQPHLVEVTRSHLALPPLPPSNLLPHEKNRNCRVDPLSGGFTIQFILQQHKT